MINGFDISDTLKAINNWAMEEGNESFDTSFIDSLSEWYEEHQELTTGQENALRNIVNNCGIRISEYV